MTTLENVTSAPIPYNELRGAEARELFAGFDNNLLDLIEGTAGCSPYLGQLLRRECDWLKANVARDLEIPYSPLETVMKLED